MIFPEVTLEEWLNKYPDLKNIKDTCEINYCEYCNKQIIPEKPFVKKGYVGLLSEVCPHCLNEFYVQVSITNSVQEYQEWSHIL